VRRSVSGEMPTLNDVGASSVMVRQVPLIAIESPRAASERKACVLEIVAEQPPPPEDVESCWSRDVIAWAESQPG